MAKKGAAQKLRADAKGGWGGGSLSCRAVLVAPKVTALRSVANGRFRGMMIEKFFLCCGVKLVRGE